MMGQKLRRLRKSTRLTVNYAGRSISQMLGARE